MLGEYFMELTYQINKKDVNSTINSILINELHFSTRLINKNCIYLNNDTINTRCYGKSMILSVFLLIIKKIILI